MLSLQARPQKADSSAGPALGSTWLLIQKQTCQQKGQRYEVEQLARPHTGSRKGWQCVKPAADLGLCAQPAAAVHRPALVLTRTQAALSSRPCWELRPHSIDPFDRPAVICRVY